MHRAADVFYIGDWQVTPSSNSLRQGDIIKQLEPKAMDVLIALCQQQGQVLSSDDIVDLCWGKADMGDNPVHKAINQLRKAFDDKANAPTYIETIRKRGYRIIARLNFPLNQELQAEQANWQGKSPFPGLSAFEPGDATVFFGRNEQISTLLSRVAKQVNFGRAFCLILGPSGTGKSSLVNAGLLPKLLHHNGYDGIGVVSYSQLDFADVNQHRLLMDLASAMLDWDIDGQPVFDGMSADTLAQQLQQDCQSLIQQCQLSLSKTTNTFSKPHFFLFIDRLEVLLSSPLFSDEERSHFLQLIDTLATSGGIMVFSACRNDFYPLVVSHASLMAGKDQGAHFDLLAPTRSELMQMIRLPAIAANLSWSYNADTAMSLDELLCNEATNNPDSLPMLQYTLQELYLQRNQHNELQESVYLTLGGIEGAIGKKAEEVFLQLPAAQQAELDSILSLLVTLNPDGETITSRAARWAQLSKQNQTNLVQALVDSRLFVSHLQNNEACFSLAHEALLRRWPRASQWISAHKDSLAIKSRLHLLTQRWLNEGKSKAYLLAEGKPLQEALSLQHRPLFKLEPDEQNLIHSSLKRVKLKRWSTGITIVILCLLTFTSVLMSIKSQESQSIAQQKRLEAESLLGFMVGEFADKLRSVKRMDLLDGISNKALEYFTQGDEDAEQASLLSFAHTGQNFKARFQHAQTLGAMGEVAYSRGKNDEAQQAFSSAKVLLDKLYTQQPDNLELLKTLGANAFWLGQLAYDQSDYVSAQPLFELYRDYSEQMNQLEPDNVDGWTELYYAHSTLGSLYLKQQNYLAAKKAFESSLALNNQVIEHRPLDDVLRSDKADTLSWLADIELHAGNLSDSLSLKYQGLTILEQLLSTSPENARIMELLMQSHMQLANLYELKQQNQNALSNLLMAEQLIKGMLGQDKDNNDWRNDLLLIHLMEATIKSKNQLDADVTLKNIDEVTNIISGYEHLSVKLLFRIIRYLQINKQWTESEKYIRLVKNQIFAAEAELIKDQNQLEFLSKIELLQANLHFVRNETNSAYQSCQNAIKLLAPIVVKTITLFTFYPM